MNEDYQEKDEQKQRLSSKTSLILSILSFIGVIVLFIFHFTGNKSGNIESTPQSATQSSDYAQSPNRNVSFDDNLAIGYVDTDRIMKEYKLVEEIQKDVNSMRERKTKQFENKISKLQSDVQSYMQTGSSLSLAQQQEREAEFQRRESELANEEQQIMAEITDYNVSKNIVLADSIVSYINRYNKNYNYTLILEKSGINGVIYGDTALDITSDIVNGLNEEYLRSK
ncbi:MAG: OmpH family outer membrane protein [Bacteroidales bacterium]|jgi:outer membrane protein|nr:OmpH family outer membrane protein [Bacteroidales bacterium]